MDGRPHGPPGQGLGPQGVPPDREDPVKVQAGAGDVVDDLPPFVGAEGEDVVRADVGVVPPAPREADVHLVLGETEVAV